MTFELCSLEQRQQTWFVDVWQLQSLYSCMIGHTSRHTLSSLLHRAAALSSSSTSPPSLFVQALPERWSQPAVSQKQLWGDCTLAADPSELTPSTHYSPAGLSADCRAGWETVYVIGLQGGTLRLLSPFLCFCFRVGFLFYFDSLAWWVVKQCSTQ